MEKKKQRIISAVIGVILASLLVYIGFRIVSQRASQASQPESFSCARVDIDTCRCSGITKSDVPLLLRYSETFYFRMESVNIEPQADGTYKQEADINNLGSGQIPFFVENHEDVRTSCDPYTASAGSEDPKTDSDPLLDNDPVSSPQPTTVQSLEPTDALEEPEPTEATSLEREALDRDTADAFFEDSGNADADAQDCFEEFKADYYGVVQVCNESWRAAQ